MWVHHFMNIFIKKNKINYITKLYISKELLTIKTIKQRTFFKVVHAHGALHV